VGARATAKNGVALLEPCKPESIVLVSKFKADVFADSPADLTAARPTYEHGPSLSLNPKAADFVPREDSEALRLFWETAGLWSSQCTLLSSDYIFDLERMSWIESSILNPGSSFFSSADDM
jgi:hypothetical protein